MRCSILLSKSNTAERPIVVRKEKNMGGERERETETETETERERQREREEREVRLTRKQA